MFPQGVQRQKVSLVVQLHFNTISKALCFLGERGKIKSDGWLVIAQFIKLVSDWFGIFKLPQNRPIRKTV